MLYAIGDCHGRLDLVTKLYQAILEDIEKVNDPQGNKIICLGDYIDRGPDSRGVLDFLMNLKDSDTIKHIFLLGNHEDMMINSCNNIHNGQYYLWMNNGGDKTLTSFGVKSLYSRNQLDIVIKPYIEWLSTLPFYYTEYDYIFCHSGFIRTDFPISLDAQKNELIWGRPHKGMYKNFDKWVICGHTPQNGKPYVEANFINCDSGGWWGKLNTLAAAALPHGKLKMEDIRFIQIWL